MNRSASLSGLPWTISGEIFDMSKEKHLRDRARSKERRNKVKYLIGRIKEGDVAAENELREIMKEPGGKRAVKKIIKEHGSFTRGRNLVFKYSSLVQGGAVGLGKRR